MGSAKYERSLSTRVLQGTPNAVGLSGLDYLLSTDILHSFGLPPLCPCQGLATKCSLGICLSSWPYRRDPHYSSLMSPEFTFAVGMSSRWASASRHPDFTTSRTRESIGSLWVCFLVCCSVTGKAWTTGQIHFHFFWPVIRSRACGRRERPSKLACCVLPRNSMRYERAPRKGTNVVFLLLP